ncbi:MAG: preprotein translocase subunit SecY [Opitutia bacterium]|nr:preprotein translocase subunit SecY [Opitutales bacterium]PHX69370.1 MAG: preprotein translocase subunit SecY [Opitutae bacterium]
MFSAFANCWRIPELRARLIVTVALIFVARIGANIPLPGIDPKDILEYYNSMADQASGGVVAMYNMFTGGALLKGAIFSLGIMPYISASIIMQLMSAVVPSIARLQQEGDVGRQKIAQYSRYLTIAIAIVQSGLLLGAFCNPGKVGQALGLGNFTGTIVVMESKTLFVLLGICLLTAGSIVMLWLGEQITQRGIGNGTSVLITIGILADIPGAITSFASVAFGGKIGATEASGQGWEKAVGMIILFALVTAAMVAINQAVRKISIQYAQRMVGRKMYGAQSNYLPLKVNYAGVMPVIFAGAILSFPPMLLNPLSTLTPTLGFLHDWAGVFQTQGWFHYISYAVLIFGFSYFWISIMFRPVQIADDLKKNNGYILGVRPGEHTAQFLDFVMTRLTVAGSLFLLIIALMPDLFTFQLGFPMRLASFLGGTGGLITVGVMLDTMRQIETYLLQSNYEGFLKKGRIGSLPVPQSGLRNGGEESALGSMPKICFTIFFLGIAAWVANHWESFVK